MVRLIIRGFRKQEDKFEGLSIEEKPKNRILGLIDRRRKAEVRSRIHGSVDDRFCSEMVDWAASAMGTYRCGKAGRLFICYSFLMTREPKEITGESNPRRIPSFHLSRSSQIRSAHDKTATLVIV